MRASDFVCPHCMYVAPLSMFENKGNGEMGCKRCRSTFKDPDAYESDVAYADCDMIRPVTRFPFSLNEKSTVIHVREGYLAFLLGPGGQQQWIEERDRRFVDLTDSFQLYYICLTPRVSWGVSEVKAFGAYGSAQLSLSKEYVMHFCSAQGQVLALEGYLRDLVNRYMTAFINLEVNRQHQGLLEKRDAYLSVMGDLEEGCSLIRIDPMGYRNASGKTGSFPTFIFQEEQKEASDAPHRYKPPVEIISQPKTAHTVKNGVEEVLCHNFSRFQRHKAGDLLDAGVLRGVDKLLRYQSKEFEYPCGWGIYNQPLSNLGFYSAQGTITFYIDSTESFSRLLYKAKNWRDFEEQFFSNVLKRELQEALRDVLSALAAQQYFQPEKIGDYLSVLSVDVTNRLNGESAEAKEPAFRRYGLRVKQTDIFSIHFYADRR